jgi:hypothetical protein
MPALALQIAAPDAGALDDVFLALGIGFVLRPLEIIHAFPARLRAAKRLPVELDVEPFGGKKAFLLGHEIVEAHALGSDLHVLAAHGSSFARRYFSTAICRGSTVSPTLSPTA